MKEQFLTYELNKKLLELGCRVDTIATIDQTEYLHIKGTKNHPRGSMMYDTIPALLWQQVFDWLDKEFGLFVSFDKIDNTRNFYYDFMIIDSKNRDYNDEDLIDSASRILDKGKYNTYEEARLECLKKLIEIITEQ